MHSSGWGGGQYLCGSVFPAQKSVSCMLIWFSYLMVQAGCCRHWISFRGWGGKFVFFCFFSSLNYCCCYGLDT